MLSFIELALLIAVFLTLRALSRWLKAYVARVESKDLQMKALALFATVLPFPAPGKTGVARHVFWVPVQLLVLIVLYVAYCMARIAYWDHEVRQLCAKDGGVTIYERIEISREEADLMGRVAGFLGPSVRSLSKEGVPVYASEMREKVIQSWQPSVSRREYSINVVSSEKIIANVVQYGRSGGDPLGPWEPSRFVCPEYVEQFRSINRIFLIK